MSAVLDLLKWIDAPGSIPFLVICLTAGVVFALWRPRHRRLAAAWMGLVLGSYLVLAMPVVARGIAGALPALASPVFAPGHAISTLVVFDGDNRRGRVREALRIWTVAAPHEVVSLGLEGWMDTALVEAGIPRARFRHDRSTSTTRQQIEWVKARVDRRKTAHDIVIVASRLQMPRIDALIRARGIAPLLAPAPADIEPVMSGWRAFVPVYAALRISRDALYEHFALRYYTWKGWIE